MTLLRSRSRLALVALLLVAPLAAADNEPDPVDLEGLLRDLPPPGTVLDIHEDGLTFEGPAENPQRVLVEAPDHSTAFAYQVDEDGRARVDVAGRPFLQDATLVRMEGHPMQESFTFFLQDAKGNVVPITVDRSALETNLGLPLEDQLPPVTVSRPLAWPGAPTEVHLLYLADGANRLAPDELTGGAFLQRDGLHKAVVQVPADKEWDRVALQARRAGSNGTLNASLVASKPTEDATLWRGQFRPSELGLADGDTVEVQVFFERRLAPIVVERFLEPALHRYRVDGGAPTVSIAAPAETNDFRFGVSWNGADEMSGIGGFEIDYREGGAGAWTRWEQLTTNSATFSGKWSILYEFRVRALDKVGNPSADHAMATTRVGAQPAGADATNDAPVARFLAPRAGDVVSGVVTVAWEASDPDGAPVTSRVEVSEDDGLTWRTLFAGEGASTMWDTTREIEGAGYRLRVTVKDGTLSASDALSSLAVRNIVLPEAPVDTGGATPPSVSPTAPTAEGAAADEGDAVAPANDGGETKETPAPFVGLALGAAALLAARRRRAQ